MPLYIPGQMPRIDSVEELRRYLEEELRRLSQSFIVVDDVTFNVLYAAPVGPVDGMVVYADGTTWNPGAGRGLYEYRSGAWVKL